jgi:hypothetical protein
VVEGFKSCQPDTDTVSMSSLFSGEFPHFDAAGLVVTGGVEDEFADQLAAVLVEDGDFGAAQVSG